MLLRLSLVIVLLALSCSRSHVGSDASQQTTAVPSPAPKIEVIPSPTPVQPIRLVDFKNVNFPHYPVYTDRAKEYVALKFFRLKGTTEVLPNPRGDANPVMPFYDGPSI